MPREMEAEMSEQHRQLSGQSVAGRYLLGNYLGGTDHSAVFATEIIHARSQRVAIKLIPADGIVIGRQLARWKALSAISHPNLLKIVDYGKCDLPGGPYLYVVMEHADEDLADILPQRALNGEETRAMMEPVIETLAFLHEQNLVHTRLHPANILATGDQIKLSSDSIAPKGEGVGFSMKTEGFSPPEWGPSPASTAEDIWSLGATLIAALTQNPPLVAEDGVLQIPANLPDPFAGIVRESLKKDPAQRTTVLGIRARLNPSSAPPAAKPVVEVAKEPARKEPARIEPARIDPVAVPVSKVSPPAAAERRPPIPQVSRTRPSDDEKQSFVLPSYVLPIMAGVVVIILLFSLPKLFRQKSDAAPAEVATNSASVEKASAPKTAPTSKATTSTPKKSASAAPAITETSQPAAPAPAPPVKTTNQPSGGNSTRGEVLDQVLPAVSDKARGTIHGTVRISVRAHVNPGGTVDSAALDAPAGSQYFSEQAIKAAKRWQFSAPEVAGRSVESDWLLRFEFTSSVTNVHATQVSP
jgi:eukaryotic-like serine/threonine-protein kinase